MPAHLATHLRRHAKVLLETAHQRVRDPHARSERSAHALRSQYHGYDGGVGTHGNAAAGAVGIGWVGGCEVLAEGDGRRV